MDRKSSEHSGGGDVPNLPVNFVRDIFSQFVTVLFPHHFGATLWNR